MSFFQRLFRRRETRSDRGVDGWPLPLAAASPHAAENLAAVFGCVQAVATAISALPVFVYRRAGKARHEVETGGVVDLIRNGPNQNQTWPEFIEFLVAQILLRGNGLVEIEDDGPDITGLRVLPWHWVNPQMLPSGRLLYDVFDQPGLYSPAQGKRRRLLDSQVIHVRDRGEDGVIGRSRLQRCAGALSVATEINEMARSLLANGLNPSAVLSTERDLAPDAKEKIRESMAGRYGGAANAGKLMLLTGGAFNLQKLSISPEDAELLESRKFSTEEICRIFQVPPPIVQDYSHNTFTNSEQAGRWFAQFCLLPWVRKLEASFNRALFPGGEHELAFDMAGFDRGDPATRWAAHAIAVSNSILDVNEVREIEGFGPKAEGV